MVLFRYKSLTFSLLRKPSPNRFQPIFTVNFLFFGYRQVSTWQSAGHFSSFQPWGVATTAAAFARVSKMLAQKQPKEAAQNEWWNLEEGVNHWRERHEFSLAFTVNCYNSLKTTISLGFSFKSGVWNELSFWRSASYNWISTFSDTQGHPSPVCYKG